MYSSVKCSVEIINIKMSVKYGALYICTDTVPLKSVDGFQQTVASACNNTFAMFTCYLG